MSARTIRHESAIGCWEMTNAKPASALRPYVREYSGWFEHMASPLIRREPPTDIIPLIINFGAPVRVFDDVLTPGAPAPRIHTGDLTRWTDYDSFTTGPFDRVVLVGSAGPSGGIQVNLTILGARLFLGRPLHDLTNRLVSLDDLFGRAAASLVMELYDAPTWDARFAILDREIAARIAAARAPSPAVLWTWRRLVETRGRIPIGAIVGEVGWSQKHLIAQFRDEIGLPPKTLARVLRFGHAVQLIRAGHTRFVDVANDCGYYDQAHFNRDVREFAGITPSELLRSLMPDSGGFAVER